MAWWLAYEELYGDMDKEYPIMKKREDKKEVITLGGSDEGTVTFTVPEGAVAAADTINIGSPIFGSASPDTIAFTGSHVKGGMGEDHISFNPGFANTAYDDPKYYATSHYFGDDPYPTVGSIDDSLGYGSTASVTFGGDVDPIYAHHFPGTDTLNLNIDTKPQPDLTSEATQKYGEDKGIADLKDYVSSTYSGHYTSRNNNVQTLDLIQSVGDAESFCRSNAIKYLSRYDKKGQAKKDILKAMHYCLLLYYFSGNTQEPDYTNTRYETF